MNKRNRDDNNIIDFGKVKVMKSMNGYHIYLSNFYKETFHKNNSAGIKSWHIFILDYCKLFCFINDFDSNINSVITIFHS